MQTFTSIFYYIKAIVLFAVFSNLVFAEDETSPNSNLNNFAYPKHKCKQKPTKPIKPQLRSFDNNIEQYNQEISNYNINVANYNKRIKIYKSCINQYIRNGNHDINTIRQQLNNALKQARTK